MKKGLILFLLITASTAGWGQLYFAPRVNYTLPVSSTFINYAFGDFNKDGSLDMVVANFSAANITVFLGAGNGTFGAGTNFAVGSGPGGISVFDFNGDGNLDLAVVNFNSGNFGILMGNGAGSFAAQTTFSTASGPQYPFLGDYNEDGKIDIAIANFLSNTVTIHTGNGTGTFVSIGSYPTGSSPNIVMVDLNNDSHLDMIVEHTGGGDIGVRNGVGNGTFGAATAYTTGSNPRGIAIADFNGDTKYDIAVGNVNSNTVSILTGLGNGLFNPAINFATGGPSTILSGDFNVDGITDLAISNTGNNTVSIYTGNGDATFSLYQYTTVGSSPNYMRLALLDLNGDGLLDIVTTNDNSNVMGVLLGNVSLPNSGTALALNGTNQRADLGTWFNHPDFTVSFWVKPGVAQGANAAVIDNNYSLAKSWTFQQNGANTNQYFFDHNGATSNLVTLAASQWQHVALVSANGLFSIYLNGQFVTSRNGGAIVYDGSQFLRLGNSAGTQYWNGELDEVRFYNAALTPAQIQSSLCAEIPSTSPNLVAYYHMNEGGGTAINDVTATHHTGTLVNAPLFSLSTVAPPVPTIVSFAPAARYVGAVIKITGTNFNPIAGANDVRFNGARALVIAATATELQAVVPANATSGRITVSENCETATSTTDFTLAPNTIVSVEHFVDTEPGIGNGIVTTVTPTAVVTDKDIGVNVNALAVGNHTLYIRAKDNNGRLNEVFANPFAVGPPIANAAPVIETTSAEAAIDGSVDIDLSILVSDEDGNIDLTTLVVLVQPQSGALATITAGPTLHVDYEGISFSGIDHLTLQVCDQLAACTQQQLEIEVAGEITVFNALSPNGDGKNDTWIIKYIELLPATSSNTVTVYNRWGDSVFEQVNYDNVNRVFRGNDRNGHPLPTGTYFYKIKFNSAQKALRGYLVIR